MDEPLLIHLAIVPFVAECGADVPNQHTAPVGTGKVTCPECILKLPDAGAWNARYLCYAASQRREPEAQLAYDRLRYPGGRMAGYITWINEKTRQHKALDQGRLGLDLDTWLTVVVRRPRGDVPKLLRQAAKALGRAPGRMSPTAMVLNPEAAREAQAELGVLINELFAQAAALEEAEQLAKALEKEASS